MRMYLHTKFKFNRGYLLLSIVFLLSTFINAQEVIKKNTSKLNVKSKSIENSYLNSDNELIIATKYEDLATELAKQTNYTKAEEYQNKAIEIYTKLKSKKKLADALRVLAKLQEAQNKTKAAIENYDKASVNSSSELNSVLNNSDASRLKNADNAAEQSNSINQKISSINKQGTYNAGQKTEIVESYKQLAEVDLKNNKPDNAIKNYNNALNNISNNESESNAIKNEIADIYANTNKIEEAINIKNAILEQAKTNQNVGEQIKMQQSLGQILILNNQEDKGLQLIQDAYNLSLKKGKTIEAKNTLMQLIRYYKSNHNNEKTLQLYESFLGKLESLIKSDSTLIDKQLFEETDQKLKLLEQEKNLKDELISKKNMFNYFLLAALIVLIILIIIIIKYSNTVRIKNKKISLQSLRREMNPHFIFNSLNSVNQFIAQNDELKANKYLTSYSNLMRTMMENSSKDFISLQKEIEQLQKYLELEHLRFNDKFDFKITIDESLDIDSVQIPNMIIQPHLENAIWHGLRYKDVKGLLHLEIKKIKNTIQIIIDDDGIGIEKSKQLKTQNQKSHKSIGITNVEQRITLLNDLYNINITSQVINKPNNSGTTICISVPNSIH